MQDRLIQDRSCKSPKRGEKSDRVRKYCLPRRVRDVGWGPEELGDIVFSAMVANKGFKKL